MLQTFEQTNLWQDKSSLRTVSAEHQLFWVSVLFATVTTLPCCSQLRSREADVRLRSEVEAPWRYRV